MAHVLRFLQINNTVSLFRWNMLYKRAVAVKTVLIWAGQIQYCCQNAIFFLLNSSKMTFQEIEDTLSWKSWNTKVEPDGHLCNRESEMFVFGSLQLKSS